jgi:hypothetical protein
MCNLPNAAMRYLCKKPDYYNGKRQVDRVLTEEVPTDAP